MAVKSTCPNLGPRVSIVDPQRRAARRGSASACRAAAGQFISPHGLAVDSRGDIYVGEVSWTAWQNYTNPGQPVPPNLRSLQKLERVPR